MVQLGATDYDGNRANGLDDDNHDDDQAAKTVDLLQQWTVVDLLRVNQPLQLLQQWTT
jgi:hypothetical protein